MFAVPALVVGQTTSYSFVSTAIGLHEPVVVEFRVRNDGARPIQFDLGKDRKEVFIIGFSGPDGRKGKDIQLRREGIGLNGLVSLEVGQSYQGQLLLNEWIDFARPGKYDIEIRLSGPKHSSNDDSTNSTEAFRGTLQILPENLARLESVCASLEERVEGASSYEDAAYAASALGFVRHDVAVPYLERALYAHQLVQITAINGLEKIGSRRAVDVLIGSLSRLPEDIAVAAKASLHRIADRTTDRSIRQDIERVLASPP
jgi:hypothetical protein